MGYVVYMSRLAFQPTDKNGIPTGGEEVVERGGDVPDYVAPFLINALASAGMIVDAGDRNAEIRPLDQEPRSLANPDSPPGPTGPALVDLMGSGVGDTASPVGERPDGRASKAQWEAYAVSVGIDQADAESMTKQELQAEVARREASTS